MVGSNNRNTIMILIALFAAAFLVAAAFESAIALSYISILFIVAVASAAAIETRDSELDIRPLGGVIVGLGVIFLIGMTGIWLTWSPGMEAGEYSYIVGLPTSTAIYLGLIWLVPFLVTVYYSIGPFEETINDEVIDTVLDEAQEAQTEADLPMASANESSGGDD